MSKHEPSGTVFDATLSNSEPLGTEPGPNRICHEPLRPEPVAEPNRSEPSPAGTETTRNRPAVETEPSGTGGALS